MDAKIYVAIPCHGRKRIAEQCIPTVKAGMLSGDHLACFYDGLDPDYDAKFTAHIGCDSLCVIQEPIGIERQRAKHFRLFGGFNEFTHLYLTDSDALHDPAWRSCALRLQQESGGAPVCLYNTDAHVRLNGNTMEDNPIMDFILRRVAPGISYLLTRAHAEVIIRALPHLPDYWHWDWTTPGLLGNRFAVARESHVDHIGFGGMHHPEKAGLDGGDVALNPTPWLITKRREVVKKLSDHP